MATDLTRQRLLDEAERLFAERGYEGTSLRALADAAGVNVAAVNYHFRSKEGLLKAVVARAMEPVNTERDRRLRALRDRPSVEQLVRAFVEPSLDLAANHRSFIGRVLFDPSPRIRQLFAEQVDPVEGRFLDALQDAVPEQDPDVVLFGYTSMLGLLALQQAATFKAVQWRGGRRSTSSPDDDRERLIAFIVAGLTSVRG